MNKQASAMYTILVFSLAHPQTADEVITELKASQKLEDGKWSWCFRLQLKG